LPGAEPGAAGVVKIDRVTHEIVEAENQVWYTVACRPDCANAGPWVVYGPENAIGYSCSICGRRMSVGFLVEQSA
jgi:hypothetical protein